MTADEASHVEKSLGLAIPAEVKGLFTDEEFCEDYAPTGLLTDDEAMLRENRRYRETNVVKDFWKPEWLAIHADGCGNVYFLNTVADSSPVYELDHEKTFSGYDPLAEPVFPDLGAFLKHLQDFELE